MTREEIIDELEEQISRCLKENSKDCKKIFHFLSNALDSIEMWKDSDDAVSREDVHDMLINIVPFRGDSFEVWMHKACSKLTGLQSVYPKAKEPKWIPVSERLPETFEFVNCTCHSLIDDREDWVIETVYVPQPSNSPYSDWGNIPMLNVGACEVVAWMHRDIPKPYKAESEDKE